MEIKIEILKTNGETVSNHFTTVEEAKAFIDEVTAGTTSTEPKTTVEEAKTESE